MCRSRREFSNAYLLAKIGVDTAENEPLEVWGENSIQYSLHSLMTTYSLFCPLLGERVQRLSVAATSLDLVRTALWVLVQLIIVDVCSFGLSLFCQALELQFQNTFILKTSIYLHVSNSRGSMLIRTDRPQSAGSKFCPASSRHSGSSTLA